MCWSAEVSLITFITSATMCVYIWYRNHENDRPLALWIFVFSLMQLFETFMWLNMNNHSFVSKLSLVFILTQPVVLGIALSMMGAIQGDNGTELSANNVNNANNTSSILVNTKWIRPFLWILIGIGIIKVIYTTYWLITSEKNKKWLSIKGDNCHLVWYFTRNSSEIPYLARINESYYLPLLLTCLLVPPSYKGLIYAGFGVLSFNFSQWYFGAAYGSIWCWIANALALITVLIG